MHSTIMPSLQPTYVMNNIRSLFTDEPMVQSTQLILKPVKKLRIQEPDQDSFASKKTALSVHNKVNINNEDTKSFKSLRKYTYNTQPSDEEESNEDQLNVAGKKMNLSQNLFQIKKSNIRSSSNQPLPRTPVVQKKFQNKSSAKFDVYEGAISEEESATLKEKKEQTYVRPSTQYRRKTVNLGEQQQQGKTFLQLNLAVPEKLNLKPALPKFSNQKRKMFTVKIASSEQQISNQGSTNEETKESKKQFKPINFAELKRLKKAKESQQDQVDRKEMLEKIQDINYDIYLRNSSENYVFTRHAIPKQEKKQCKFCGKDTLAQYQFLVQEILDGACCSSCFTKKYLKCSCCKKPNEFIDRVYAGNKISRYQFRINWRMQHNKLFCKNCYIENRCQCKECVNRYNYLYRPKTSGAIRTTTNTTENDKKL